MSAIFLQPGFENLRQIELIEPAKVVIDKCLAVKPGETVLIVSDPLQSTRLGEALAMAVSLAKANYVLMYIRQQKYMYGPGEVSEPTKAVAGAIKGADAVYFIGTTGLIWSKAVQSALKSGTRILSSPRMSEDNFVRCIMVDFEKIWETNKRVQAVLRKGAKARLTSPEGTDLTFEIGNPPIIDHNGTATNPGDWDFLPTGFGSASLIGGTANGTLVVDGAAGTFRIIKNPITLTLRNGALVKAEGGYEAREFVSTLDLFGDPKTHNLGSIWIGTNPNAKLTGFANEDERIRGMLSFMFGDNAYIHDGDNPATHYKVVTLTSPRLEIDGKLVLDEGQLKV